MSKTAIIAGASGQVGGYLLKLLLQSPEYTKVIAVGRNLLEINDPQLEQKIVDFNTPETLNIYADDVYCCLGTTIKKAKTKENFRNVDYGYVMALANSTFQAGASKFMVVSSMGAELNSSIFYSRVKAEMERDLKSIGFKTLGIFKPSMLLGPRKEFRFGEYFAKFLMQLFAPIIPMKYKGVHAKKVAEAMVKFANGNATGALIISNSEILT
jgi:uncharacterized protein YbjT (DUF2867 family)